MITEKEGRLLGIIRAKKLQARKFIGHHDHNSDYWRGAAYPKPCRTPANHPTTTKKGTP